MEQEIDMECIYERINARRRELWITPDMFTQNKIKPRKTQIKVRETIVSETGGVIFKN